ncbi:hypothetical protein [Pseudonocardia sp.]|jgi:hypothetical protein|uniref:hypothetical protein n=1 Tax=Pseudonocardia sp. TaxID=60912 RepID=UPI0031FD9C9E
MEILEAFDLTGSLRDAAELTLVGPAGRLQQTTRLTQTRLFTDAGVPLPPKMTGLQPAQ